MLGILLIRAGRYCFLAGIHVIDHRPSERLGGARSAFVTVMTRAGSVLIRLGAAL